jgi:hypothetical protein
MVERILTLHPDEGKQGANIAKAKYDAVKRAILLILGVHGIVTFEELTQRVQEKLQDRFEGSIGWYITIVKLDLEARRAIERVPGSEPQRLRIVMH